MLAPALGLLLAALGGLFGAPGLVVVGVLVALVGVLRGLWSQRGLRRVSYGRQLSATRAMWGEQLRLELTVRNRKLLPVPWLQIADHVSVDAVIEERQLLPAGRPGWGVLQTTWTLGWFERVTRRMTILATRRGVFDFGTVQLRVADLFARTSASVEVEQPLSYRVVPRIVPVRVAARASLMSGPSRATRGLFEEPSLFAGVRPYQPGDRLKRIHWKATARRGRPLSRRFDPGREREALIAVDMQTVEGPYWEMIYDDDLAEGLCVAAASLARRLLTDGIAVGLAVNAYSGRPHRTLHVPMGAGSGQLERLADGLAGISPFASVPFGTLLAELPRRAPAGAGLFVLSARDPAHFGTALRRLVRSGFGVSLAAYGSAAPEHVARARALGIDAALLSLDPDWRSADALALVA
jgi:uncharacterized protein (DUF58 family)